MRKKWLPMGAALCLAAVAAACSSAGAGGGNKALAPVDTTKGQAVYAKTCASCHGKEAGGGTAPNLVKSKQVAEDTESQVLEFFKKHPKVSSDQDFRDAVFYVRTLKP